MSTSNHAPKNLFRIFLAIFVLISLGTSTWVPGVDLAPPAAAQATGLRITGPDYVTDVTKVYGSEAYLYVVLTDATLNKAEGPELVRGVEVTSTTVGAGTVRIDLLETGPSTGVFRGGVRTTTGASVQPTQHPFLGRLGEGDGGQIKVNDGATITVKRASTQDTVKWVTSADGVVTVRDSADNVITTNHDFLGYGDSAAITVTDKDLNADATKIDRVSTVLRASSGNDPTGEAIELVETAVNSGIFTATLTFESTGTTGNGKLFVRPGDTIQLLYQDAQNVLGLPVSVRLPAAGATWTFEEASDGALLFDRTHYVGYTGTTASSGSDRAVIVVVDADRNTNRTRNVIPELHAKVRIAGGTEIPVRLQELGVDSVTFVGTVGFYSTAPSDCPLDACLDFPGTAPVDLVATYTDDPDAGGVTRTRTASARWLPGGSANLTVGEGTGVIVGAGPITIEIKDADRNQNNLAAETITARAKSTSDPASSTLSLTETAAASGVFRGTLRFSTGASSLGTLRVADGDRFVVEYDDPLNATGVPSRVTSPMTVWRTSVDGVVTTDATNYYQQKLAGAITTVAQIFVQDNDRNDPTMRDTIRVEAASLNILPPTSVSLTLLEVGIDSGLFRGSLTFDTATGLDVLAAGETQFQIEYTDPQPDGTTRILTSPTLSFWPQPANAIVRVEEIVTVDGLTHAIGVDVLHVSATPAEGRTFLVSFYNDQSGLTPPTSTTVQLTTSTCTAAKTITLTDNDGDHRYVGTFRARTGTTCSTGTANADLIDMTATDTLTMKVTRIDASVVTGTAVARAFAAPIMKVLKSDHTTNVDRLSGLGSLAYLQLAAPEENLHRGGRQVVTAQVTRGTSTLNVDMVETGVDTGIFRAAIGFTATAVDFDGKARILTPELKVLPVTTTPTTYQLYHGVTAGWPSAASTTGRDVFSWYAANDATLAVTKESVGSGSFELTMTDGDGMGPRVFETKTSVSAPTYVFLEKPYITASELIFVNKTQTDTETAASPTYTMSTESGTPPPATPPTPPAAEAVSDFDRNGAVGCSDVRITATRSTTPTVPPGSPTVVAVEVNCVSVTLAGVVTYTYPGAPASCTPSSSPGAPTVTCTASVTYQYRAAPRTTCPATSGSQYEYERNIEGIKRCAAGDVGVRQDFHYTKSERRVTAYGPTGEAETIVLRYSASLSAATPTALTFTGTAPVSLVAGAGDGSIFVTGTRADVVFTFNDPVQAFDGQGGNAGKEHFRAVRAVGVWRAGATGTLAVMTPNFSGALSGNAFGPSIPVQVTDRDGDTSSQLDTLAITAQVGSGAAVTFVLRETTGASGIFRGAVKVGGAGGVVIPAGQTAPTITLTYVDPDNGQGSVRTVRTPFTWRAAETAKITFHQELPANPGPTDCIQTGMATVTTPIEGTLGRLFVRVKDADHNINAAIADTLTLRVFSDSDPNGEVVSLSETGISTGCFDSAGITFEPTPIPSNGKVGARDVKLFEDEIGAVFIDTLNEEADTVTRASETKTGWDQRHDGVVDIQLPFYIGTVPTGDVDFANATVTIADGDANLDPRRVDTLAWSDATMELGRVNPATGDVLTVTKAKLVKLIETGANTGSFMGVFTFADAGVGGTAANEALGDTAAASTRARVSMENTRLTRFTYADPTPASGDTTAVEFSDEASWFKRGFGVVNFDRTGYDDLTVKPVVTLYDADITAASVSVTVVSEADPDGISVSLAKKTGRTGVYSGTLTLTKAATGGLQVESTDSIEARYTDAAPSGTRTATAAICLDCLAPSTELVTTPATADGENGWFITQPTVSFDVEGAVHQTWYILDGGAELLFSSPFAVPEGAHSIEFWSVNLVGQKETAKTGTVNFDATAPTVGVTGLTATSGPAGAIILTWTAVAGKTDPLQFGSYKIFLGTLAEEVGSATTETFSHTPTADGSHTYLVAVADMAGNTATAQAVSKSGTSDRIAPLLDSADVSPGELFEELDDNLTVTISATVRAADVGTTNRVEARVLDPFGGNATTINLTRQGTSAVWRGTFAGFEDSGTYTFQISAVDAAGNKGTLTDTVIFHGFDKAAPQVTVPATVALGAALSVTVRDNDKGIASISYTLDGGASVSVSVSGNPLIHVFAVPTAGLAEGNHTLVVTASDANGTTNSATTSHTFRVGTVVVTPPTGAPTVELVADLIESGAALRLRVQSAGPLTALTVAFDGGAAAPLLELWSIGSTIVAVPLAGLAADDHRVVVVATNAAGSTTLDTTFDLLGPGIPLPPAGLVVTKNKDGEPVLEWIASTSSNVGGYLIHRASSPSEVIAVLGADRTSYTDKSAADGKTYSYAVTAYGTGGEGRLDKGDSSTDLPWFGRVQSQSVKVTEPGGIPSWIWIALIVIVVLVGVSLAYVYREKLFGRREEEPYDESYPDEPVAAPFGVLRHTLRCPNCSKEFNVTGQKPIVTTCPNCGKKGILR